MGLAWAPAALAKTVIRAGAGLYYEPLMSPGLDAERATLGPPGLGRQLFSGTSLRNILPGIPGVPVGTSLDFRNPTLFTGADLMTILPVIRSGLVQSLANADPTIQAVQLTKQVSGTGVFPADYKTSSALHASVGVQREIARDFVLSADFAYRHFVHLTLGGAVDLNHFNSIHGPVIPACNLGQENDPQAICSRGPINVQQWQGRATYKGLLLRADKRFSHGFQILGSYAYSQQHRNKYWQRLQSRQLASKPRAASERLHQHPESCCRRAFAAAFRARTQFLVFQCAAVQRVRQPDRFQRRRHQR